MSKIEQNCLLSPDGSLEDLKLEKTINLGIMASGSGSNFETIAQAIKEGTLNAKISVVIYNNPDAKVKLRAEKFGIPTVLLNHREFKTRKALDQAIVEVFKEYEINWVIMAGWMRIVTEVLLNAYPNHVLNIHPSLLPSFRGINGVEQALQANVKITGCTVHIASLDVDSGPIIIQSAVPILPQDTPETLHARIQIQEHKLYPLAIALVAKNEELKP